VIKLYSLKSLNRLRITDFEGLSVEVEPYEEIVEGLRYSRPEGIADH